MPIYLAAFCHPDDEYKRHIPVNLVHHAVPADPDSPRSVRAGHSPASCRLRIACQGLYLRGNALPVTQRKPSHLPARCAMPLDFVAHGRIVHILTFVT